MASLISYTFNQAKSLKEEAVWERLSKISIREAIKVWIKGFTYNTARAYRISMDVLDKLGIISLDWNLQVLSLVNHQAIITQIQDIERSPATIQVRCAAYISFIRYLSSMTEGVIKRAFPDRTGARRVFYTIREKAATNALTPEQWEKLLSYVTENGMTRERLIMIILLQSGKRISEVLSLNISDVDFRNRRICFKHKKTWNIEKYSYVIMPQYFFDDLKKYIAGRIDGPLFVTMPRGRVGKRLPYVIARKRFRDIGAEVGFKFHPHMLRVSCVTFLRSMRVPDHEIQKITGHAKSEMISHYDKRELWYNVSRFYDVAKDYQRANCYFGGPSEHCEYQPKLEEALQCVQEV